MSPIGAPDKRYEKGGLTPKRKSPIAVRKPSIPASSKKRGRSTSSNSGSSESSSESDSSYSSSSTGSSDESSKHIRSRDKVLSERKMASKKGNRNVTNLSLILKNEILKNWQIHIFFQNL